MEKGITDCSNVLSSITEEFQLQSNDIKTYSPLVLAYMGDCIFDLIIRTVLISHGNRQTNKIHRESSRLVNAASQAALIEAIEDTLTEEEHAIYKRGKNANPHTIPKNADISDYKKATGLEALMGYLYLKGDLQRAIWLVKLGFDRLQITN